MISIMVVEAERKMNLYSFRKLEEALLDVGGKDGVQLEPQ
jgi:hypothetical protein